MSTLARITVVLALASAMPALAVAAAGDGVPVPNRELPAAKFAAPEGTERTFVAQGADGARMVAFESALLTALVGSRVELAAKPTEQAGAPNRLILTEGGFHVIVGSIPVDLQLDGHVLRVVRAGVIAVREGKTWVVQVKPEAEGGSVELLMPEPIASAPEVATTAASAPEPLLRPLAPGARHTLEGGEEPRKAAKKESRLLAKAIERLIPDPGPRTALLEPRPVEDPRDLAVRGATADAALSDIELEEIEVEVGCVEICVD